MWYKHDQKGHVPHGKSYSVVSFASSADALLSLLFPSCAKLNKVAQGKGNATHDQVCMDQLPSYLTPDTSSIRTGNETNDSDVLKLPANLVTLASVLSSATTKIPSSTPEEKALASTSPTSAKGETTTRGQKGFILSGTFYSDISLVKVVRELPA